MAVYTNSKGIDYYNTNKAYEAKSELAKGEKGDCVVRTLAAAFDISYEKAHKWAADKWGRKPRQGTYYFVPRLRSYKEVHERKVEELGILKPGDEGMGLQMIWPWNDRGDIKYAKYTVGKFLKEYQEGVYIISTNCHAFVIRDGVVMGNTEDAIKLKVRVENAFKITEL